MKKKNILFALAASLLLVGCSATVEAKPGNVDDPLVNFSGASGDYFRNDYQTIYDQLVDAGTSNSTILNALLEMIAKDEEKGIYSNSFTTEAHIKELCQQKMIDKVKSGSYDVDGLFQETKLINELKSSLYDIKKVGEKEANDNYLLLPSDEYETVEEEYNAIFHYDYNDYIERSIKQEVLISELTAKYLYDEDFSNLGKSNARRVKYIALQEIDTHNGEAARTINAFINDFENKAKEDKNAKFDLNALSNIWRGVNTSDEEKAFIKNNNLYTLADQIEEEIAKIVETDVEGNPVRDDDGEWKMKDVKATDDSLEAKYTNSYSYSVEYGYELAKRDLAKKEFVQDDLYIRNNGINDLPSSITDRIFSSRVDRESSGFIKEVNGIKFLTPAKTENNGNLASKIVHYDSSTGTRYVVIIEDVYNSTVFDDAVKNDDKAMLANAVEIAEILADNSTNKRDAIIHYLKEFNIEIHDQAFYDYIDSTYGEVFDEEE